MQRGCVFRGKVSGRRIELDESVDELEGNVEVFVKPLTPVAQPRTDLRDVLRRLPQGSLGKVDVDARLRDARHGWDERG
jgi:hypothetical protein